MTVVFRIYNKAYGYLNDENETFNTYSLAEAEIENMFKCSRCSSWEEYRRDYIILHEFVQ